MNPSSNNAGMELPPPAVEQSSGPALGGESNFVPLEAQPATQEQASSPGAVAPVMSAPSMPAMPASNPILVDNTSQDDNSQLADPKLLQDKDLIDKEWVNKAKSIIEKDREDPYKQTEDITMLKADYMKQQFNKTLKLNK